MKSFFRVAFFLAFSLCDGVSQDPISVSWNITVLPEGHLTGPRWEVSDYEHVSGDIDSRLWKAVDSASKQAVKLEESLTVYISELERNLADSFPGRTDPIEFPPLPPAAASLGPQTIALSVATKPLLIQKISLILASKDLRKIKGTAPIQLLDGGPTLTTPEAGILSLGASAYSVFAKPDKFPAVTNDLNRWGKRFEVFWAITNEESETGHPDLDVKKQVESALSEIIQELFKKGVIIGGPLDVVHVKSSAQFALREVFGSGAFNVSTLSSSGEHAGGKVTLLLEHRGFPDGTVIAGGVPVLEEHANNFYLSEEAKQDGNALLIGGGLFVTSEMRRADEKYLMSDPKILSASVNPITLDDSYTHEVNLEQSPVLPPQIGLTSAFGSSPDEGVTAKLDAEFLNFGGDVKTLKFSVKGGERILEGEADIVIPITPYHGPGAGTGFDYYLSADSLERENALVGNIIRPPVDESATHASSGLRFYWDTLSHIERFQLENPYLSAPNSGRIVGKVDLGLSFLSASLDGPASSITGLDEGSELGPELKGGLVYEPSIRSENSLPGFHRVLLENHFDLRFGFEGPGDSGYTRFTGSSGYRAFLLPDSKFPCYFLQRASVGYSSSGAPTYEYIGSGTDRFVRGLELDEFIGRSYFAVQNEIGVDIQPLLALFSDSSEKEPKTDSSKIVAPFSSPVTYLTFFADFGWLDDRFQDGRDISGSQSLHGYGVSINVTDWSLWRRPASLSVGYAYSPDSIQHDSGVVFSSINFQF